MDDDKSSRLSRLTAIITLLQSKSLVTATEMSTKYGVSIRTVYRDIRSLESSGVPIVTEEGKGYTLMDGYKLPPIMFTEQEAFALITSEKLIMRDKDSSLVTKYSEAIQKIKAVLKSTNKRKAEFLNQRVHIGKNYQDNHTSHALIDIQIAMANYQVVKISYKNSNGITSERQIEPFYIYHSLEENWTVHAYCRTKKEFRTFRLDRMNQVKVLDFVFKPHKTVIKSYFGKKFIAPVYP